MGQQELLDQFALQQLAYRYASAVDARDAAALAKCFDDDLLLISPVAEMRGNGSEIAKKITAILTQQFVWTMHNVHNIDYVIDGAAASGRINCVASHISKKDNEFVKWDWYIRYSDKAVKHDGEWRYSERRLDCEFTATQTVQRFDISK